MNRGWTSTPGKRTTLDGQPFGRARAYVITKKGRLYLANCDGRWDEPCREAWPASRYMWCLGCESIPRHNIPTQSQ